MEEGACVLFVGVPACGAHCTGSPIITIVSDKLGSCGVKQVICVPRGLPYCCSSLGSDSRLFGQEE